MVLKISIFSTDFLCFLMVCIKKAGPGQYKMNRLNEMEANTLDFECV
jgi:hypothetical protein